MSLTTGVKIDAYEILGLLGAGGMGEVYRARDSALKRDVAIKVLPAFVSRDTDRLRRFTQEAQAAAALNHPNILAVYGLGNFEGSPYLVSELLEGETLREQLRHGAIPIRKATGYAVQIAHALAAAHEKGIVHRDLKPENLFVTKDGRVKVLDFGLAKLMQSPAPEQQGADATQGSTTNPGMVMGTAGYMAPEQVRGETVDHRADIFALGAVLYEMLTGKRAFAKSTSAETMTAVLNDDPPAISQIVKTIPPGLQRVVQRCLEKSPEQRFHSASDLAFALEALSDSGSSPAIPQVQKSRPRWPWLVAAAVLALIAAIGIVWWRTPPAVPVVEALTQLTEDGQTKFSMSTDGSRIYFTEGAQEASRIAQVSVTGGSVAPVQTNLTSPILFAGTSDGSTLLVSSQVEIDKPGDLFLLAMPAGDPRRLRIPWTGALDLFPDGRVIHTNGNDVFITSKDGSSTRKLYSFSGRVRDVEVSPDGKRVLVIMEPAADGTFDILEIAADGTGLRQVRKGARRDCCFHWSSDANHVFYISRESARRDIWTFASSSRMFRQPDSPVRLTTGPLSYSEVISGHDPGQIFAIANKDRAELARYDFETRQFTTIFPGESASDLTYSADGKWVAYSPYPDHTLWRSRSDGSDRMQLTYPPMVVREPNISYDGTRVAFGTTDNDSFVVDMSGGEPRKIVKGAQFPVWSPDGKSLVLAKFLGDGKSFDYEIADARSGATTPIPSSTDKIGARWIDNDTVIASTRDFVKLVTFNRKTGKWTDLLTGAYSNWIATLDGKYVLLVTTGREPVLQRLRVADHHLETLTALKGFTRLPNLSWTQLRVAADGSPVITRAADNSEIYALNIKWP
jgi:eukaryotic-like serine/threonine-protein kinase